MLFGKMLFSAIRNIMITALLTIFFVPAHCQAGAIPGRYIFIDGGAHLGESLEMFRKTKLFKQHPWEIYAIEANPDLAPALGKIPDIKVISKALWVADGTLQFTLDAADDKKSSIYYNPSKIKKPLEITVASMDFGQWLVRNFKASDYIIVSLDIQGAEYRILGQMLHDGSIKYIDRLYVEFHPGLVPNQCGKEIGLIRKMYKAGVFVAVECAEGVIRHGIWTDVIGDECQGGI